MTFPEPQLITLTDPDYGSIELSVHEQGTGPAVVFSHGFPELAYSWRHQLPAVAAAGFRAIAPDQRGYGGSTAPEPVAAYGMDYKAIGVQTGEIVVRILKGEQPGAIASQYSKKLELHVNPAAAQKMGVTLPEDLVKEASKVVQ